MKLREPFSATANTAQDHILASALAGVQGAVTAGGVRGATHAFMAAAGVITFGDAPSGIMLGGAVGIGLVTGAFAYRHALNTFTDQRAFDQLAARVGLYNLRG